MSSFVWMMELNGDDKTMKLMQEALNARMGARAGADWNHKRQ